MTMHDAVEKNDKLIIFNKALGYTYAQALEDKEQYTGSAMLRVAVNSKTLPGVFEMQISVNDWDVWKEESLDGLKQALDSFLKPNYD